MYPAHITAWTVFLERIVDTKAQIQTVGTGFGAEHHINTTGFILCFILTVWMTCSQAGCWAITSVKQLDKFS